MTEGVNECNILQQLTNCAMQRGRAPLGGGVGPAGRAPRQCVSPMFLWWHYFKTQNRKSPALFRFHTTAGRYHPGTGNRLIAQPKHIDCGYVRLLVNIKFFIWTVRHQFLVRVYVPAWSLPPSPCVQWHCHDIVPIIIGTRLHEAYLLARVPHLRHEATK